MRLRAPFAVTVAVTVAGGLLAACASTVSGLPNAAPKAAFPSSTGSGGGGGSQSGAALITSVFDTMTGATSFHASADGTDDDGSTLTFDAHFGKDSSSGTIHEDGFTIKVIVVPGAAYFQGDDAFWSNVIPADKQAEALPKLRGKWVTGPVSNPDMASIADSFSRKSLIDSIREGDPPSSYSIIGTGTRSGHRVTRLRDTVDGTEVDVLASGKPFPVYSYTPASSDGGGTILFDSWDVPFTAQKPPKSQTFDATPYLH